MGEERGPIRVLAVDDDPGVCDLTRTFLERADPRIAVTAETDAGAAVERLDAESIDCVVCDYDMPGMDGLELLEAVREGDHDLPFLLFTAKGNEEIASEAIAAGVDAYLQKEIGIDGYAVLANEIQNLVSRSRAERRADQQTRINDVVREVNRQLVLADTRAEIEAAVCEIVADSSAYSFAWVAREDSTTGEIYAGTRAAVPFDPEEVVVTTDARPTARGPVGRAFRTGELQVVADTADLVEDEWCETMADHDVESLVAIPLVYQGNTYGVFVVYADRPSAFDGTEVTVLAELGDTIAAAIDGVETAEQLVARNQSILALHEATQEMMTADVAEVSVIVSETASSILDLPINAVYLIEDDEETLEPASHTDAAEEVFAALPKLRIGEGIAWEVFQTGEPKVYSDVSTAPGRYNPDTVVRSEMLLPLGGHGIFIAGSIVAGEFDSTDVSLAKLLVSSAEAALERARREETIREREVQLERKNERLAEFASIVSHDLRNPLSIAQGCTQLAQTDVEGDHLETVAQSLDRMSDLIDSLLELARGGHRIGATEAVDLESLVRTAWRTSGGADAEATLSVEDDLRVIEADPASLQQVLENLFRNAFEYAGEDASVRVGSLEAVLASDASEDPEEARSPGGSGSEATGGSSDQRSDGGFYVADDGPGIPEPDREAVFESGHTTADGGTGLGLKIVRRVADAHGWDVVIDEADGGGARFEVSGVTTLEDASGE